MRADPSPHRACRVEPRHRSEFSATRISKDTTLSEESDNLKDKRDFLLDVLRRYDHYVATTHFKVGLMMSFLGAIVLGLTIILKPVQGEISDTRYAAIIVSILTIISSLFAAIQLLRVVFPNTNNENGADSLIFFRAVIKENKNSDEYYRKVISADQERILKDLAIQTYNVAGIVNHKFKVLTVAVNTMIYVTVPLLAVSLVLLIVEGL